MYLYRSCDSSLEHNLKITFHNSKYTLVFLKSTVKGSGSNVFPILKNKKVRFLNYTKRHYYLLICK